jgi:hypothetical protein
MCCCPREVQDYWVAVKKLNNNQPLTDREIKILSKNNYPLTQRQRSTPLS